MATTNAMDVFAKLAGVSAPEAGSEASASAVEASATAAGQKMAQEVPWIGGSPKGPAAANIGEEFSMVGLHALDLAADTGSKALGGSDSIHLQTNYDTQLASANTSSDSNYLLIPPNQWSGSESGNIAMDRLSEAA